MSRNGDVHISNYKQTWWVLCLEIIQLRQPPVYIWHGHIADRHHFGAVFVGPAQDKECLHSKRWGGVMS